MNSNVGIDGKYFNINLVTNEPLNEEIKLNKIDRVEILMASFEKGLDFAGCIPLINIPAGVTRIIYGTTQMIAALGIQIIGSVASVLDDSKNMIKWEKVEKRAVYHINSGLLNIGRGFLEIPYFFIKFLVCQTVDRNEIKLVSSEEKNECEIWSFSNKKIMCHRMFYEGELKRMHLLNQLHSNSINIVNSVAN